MKIFVMGLTASGKSSQAAQLARFFGLEHISGSDTLLSKLRFKDTKSHHFWFDEDGKSLNQKRDNSDIDKKVDEYLLELAHSKTNLVFDSWIVPYLYNKDDALLIYLTSSLKARAKMAFESKQDTSFALEELELYRNVNRILTTCANRILTTLSHVYNSG